MKCRFIRNAEACLRELPERYHADLIYVDKMRNGRIQKIPHFPAGYVYDTPGAYHLVRLGVADSADDECEIAAARTPEQLAVAKRLQVYASLGLIREDHSHYDAGYLLGYNPDGSWIPGPNYAEYERLQKEADEAEEL